MFWVLPAAYNYLKGKKVDWNFLILFSVIGLIGVYVGVLAVVTIDQRLVSIVVGTLILVLVLYVLLKKEIGLVEKKVYSRLRQSLSYLFSLILGFYESFFGSGNGILFSIVAFKTRGFDFINALGYYYAVAFLWEVFAVLLFLYKGYFSLAVMIPTIIGSVIGGYVGSRYARYKGNKFIKLMFAVVGSILGIKLLLGL